MEKERHYLYDPPVRTNLKDVKSSTGEDDNMVQTNNKYRMMKGHDGQSLSKPVDAQLFNVDLSSVPLPPAAATAVPTVEDPTASTSHSSHRQTHTPRIPRTMNDFSPPSGGTVSSISLPPVPPPLPVTTTTTTTNIHLPFPSSYDLSLKGSGVAQLACTIPQPVPPPLPLTLASASTLPHTPVPLPVPPPSIKPVPPPVGLLSLPTSSVGSYNSIAQCSTILADDVDRETSYSEDRKDGPETPPKTLSASLESLKVSNVDNPTQPAPKIGGPIRFSLKSPDGGGKPKVSFQIKRKNRPIVGEKSDSITEEEDIVNSNPGQFVTRKREMFKPAEAEATPQHLAFIKSLEVLEHVQKKQTSPTTSESSSIAEFQALLLNVKSGEKLVEKAIEKPCEKTDVGNKNEDHLFESSAWEKVDSLVCDKDEKHIPDDKTATIDEISGHDPQVQEQQNYAVEKSSDNFFQENMSNDVLHKEKSSEKSSSEKVGSRNSPEKCVDTQPPLDRLKAKSTRDRGRDQSGQDRSYERSTRDRLYDNKSSSDKPRDKSTRERSGRESSYDRSTRGSSYERGSRDKSQERSSRDWDRSRERSTQDRSYDRSTRDRSHERSSRDRLPHDRFRERSNRDRDRDRSNRDRSRERSTRERSRERSTRDRSRDRYTREKSYERSSRERSNERNLSEKGSERSSCERSKNRSEGQYDYRGSQRRQNSWDRRSRWTERYDERSSYDKYDDGRYGRSSDRYKRDTYDNRMSASHYYDDDHYGRSHHDDKRSRHDEKSFHSQDRHSRSDDNYSDRYDRRSRRSLHSSEERSSDLDSCLKSSEDTTSPCRQQYLGGKQTNMSSGISAISVHYGRASDSDSSPVRNIDSDKSYDRLQFNSTSGTSSASATNKQLTMFGQANQSNQNYNKMNECEGDTYNYGDSTPVRDEPNDYEINFSQNPAPVNSYSGFSQLYQPTPGNVNWLNTNLEPTQSIDVSQRLPGSSTSISSDGQHYSTSAVLTNVQPRVGDPANLMSINPVTANINNPTQINIGIMNPNYDEHKRIPAVLEDFPKISHNTGLAQNFGRVSTISSQNIPSILSVNQTPNVVQNVQYPATVTMPPVPVLSQLAPPPAPIPAPAAPYIKPTAYEPKAEPVRFSDFHLPQKNLAQPHAVFSAASEELEKKKPAPPIIAVPRQEFSKGAFNTSEEHKTVSTTRAQVPPSFTPMSKYTVNNKLTLSQSLSQSSTVNSSQNQIFEKPEAIKTSSSKIDGSSSANNAKYCPLRNKDNIIKTKISEEPRLTKDLIVSGVSPSSSPPPPPPPPPPPSSTTNTSVLNVKPDPWKKSIFVGVVAENVSIIEPSSKVATAGQLCSSMKFVPTDSKGKRIAASKSDVDEVSSSESTLPPASPPPPPPPPPPPKQLLPATIASSSHHNDKNTKHSLPESSSLSTVPKKEETLTVRKEERSISEDVSTAGSKDNFDEELMDVDSPDSSCNIETNNPCSSNTGSPNKGTFRNDENTRLKSNDYLGKSDKFQKVASAIPLSSVNTTGSNFNIRTEGRAVSESKFPTHPAKDQEISSSGISGQDHSEVKNSENQVSTTEYRLKKPYTAAHSLSETSTKPTPKTELPLKLRGFRAADDFKARPQSSSLQTVNKPTIQSSQSSKVTSSDDNTVKLQPSKSQFYPHRTDNVAVQSQTPKDIAVTQQKDNNSSNNSCQGSVNRICEAKPTRAGRRRPRTRWDNAGPAPILNTLEKELTVSPSKEISLPNKETPILNKYIASPQPKFGDDLQKGIYGIKSIETKRNYPSTVPATTSKLPPTVPATFSNLSSTATRSLPSTTPEATCNLPSTAPQNTSNLSSTTPENTSNLSSTAPENTSNLSSTGPEAISNLSSTAPEATSILSSTAPEATSNLSSTAPEATSNLSSTVPDATSNLASTVPDATSNLASTVPDATSNLPSAVPDATSDLPPAATSDLPPTVPAATSNLPSTATSGLSSTAPEATNNLPSTLPDVSSNLPSTAPDATSNLPPTAAEATKNLPSTAPDATSNLPPTAPEATRNLPSTAPDATSNLPPTVPEAASNPPSTVPDATINLPSTISDAFDVDEDISENKDATSQRVVDKPELSDFQTDSQSTIQSSSSRSSNSSSSGDVTRSNSTEQISPVPTESCEESKQAALQISCSNDSETLRETKSSATTRTLTETSLALADELDSKSKRDELLPEIDQAKSTTSEKSKEDDGTGSGDVTPSQPKGDDSSESNSREDRDSIVSSKPTSPENSIKDEDGCKDEDTESVSSQKSLKGTKKNESNTRVSSGTPAPRRSGRIRSLEEKRVKEKVVEKKEKVVKTKKEKKQDVKAEAEEKDKPIVEGLAADNTTVPATVKEEEMPLKESEEKKEGRRTRTRWSNKEDGEQKEEADKKKRDSAAKLPSAKEDQIVNETIKEKPKRQTRSKKQMEADKLKANESKTETEGKPSEAESQAKSNLSSVDLLSTPIILSGQSLSSPPTKKSHLMISTPGSGLSQSPLSVQKETSVASPATTTTPTTPSADQSVAAREPKKEDPLMSARPLKVKSRWRRTMEAEWLSASASISSSTSAMPTASSTMTTNVVTSNTPSPQLSPSTVALSSSSAAASTLQQPLPTSSSTSLSSYTPQMSDNLASTSQANLYPTQQQTPRPSSPPQPSIQISSSQLSPQQKPQPVVSSTFQGPEDLPITAKTINSTIVNEDPRKSYLQKPAFETIHEDDEDKKRDVGKDVAKDILCASNKDGHVRPDSEADKENSRSYEEIVDNIYLTERRRSKQMREVRRMVCDCTTSHEDRELGLEACGEDCLNRMLMIECGSRCPCSEYCQNKRFSRHQYVNVNTFKTESKGQGLMTLEDLYPHTFVMEYVGEVLDYREFKNRTKQYAKNGQEHYYFMSLNADEVIDATYRGNKSRFINHSCDPNCETQKWTVNGMLRIGFFTKKSIKAGTEMTFDYQFESKQAQKCFCGAENCRGTIGGKKKTPVKSKKKAATSDKKKKEFEDDSLEEEMERMSQLEGLKNKEHVLNLCRLMVRAESNDHRLSILRILQGTNEQACLRLFLDYHGLPLLWSWMADIGKGALYLKSQILGTLKMLPISNKTILQESKILPMVVRWANELKMTAERDVETEQSNDNSSQAGTPSSIASRDDRPPKKKVKFADETSSDSEMSECSRLSGMIYLNEPMAKNGLNEVADSSDMPYTDYSNQGSLYVDELDETRTSSKPVPPVGGAAAAAAAPKSGILIKPELQKELSSESSSSPVVEEKVQSNEAESSSLDILDKCSTTKEKTEDEVSPKDDDSSNEVKVTADEKNFDSGNLSSVVSLATDLLKHWSDLKEVFKIPKKEKVEERKRTERELERDRMDRKRRYEISPDKGHSRFRSRSDRRRDEVQELLNPNRPRRVLLPTPPKLSKEERRQQFEAQVRAQDEMAEYQKQQEAAYMQQQQEYMQQQYMGGEMPGYDYYVQQDPNLAYQQDPNLAYQQDPNMAYSQDPNAAIAYQADPNAAIYPPDPNAPYQDPSVYHGYHLPPPPTDPNAYPIQSADASTYPMAPADVNTAYQMQPTDSSAYQMHPSDPNAYAMHATDLNQVYQVPPPDPASYQAATSTDQTGAGGYIQADSSFQIPVLPPPAVGSVLPDSSYPSNTPTVAPPGSSTAVVQKPQAGSEGLLEHCYIPGQTSATVPDATSSQAVVSSLNAIPTMTPTYIEPGSSTPAIYPSAPVTPVYQVPSKFSLTPQTTAAGGYSTTTPSVPPPGQSASVPQLPPVAPQLQTVSGLASLPPSAQQNTPLTPVYVQQSQASSQQGPPAAPQAPPPAAPPSVYYPTTPQAMVVPPPQHHYPQPPAPTPTVPGSQVVQIDQSLLALQQVKQLQQQLQIQNIVLSSTTQSSTVNSMSEDDPPPPPSPPKPKVTKLPPNWKMAKDSEGKNYYYHTVTRQTQWDLPSWDQEEQDDMDLGTPTHDEPQNKVCDLFFQSGKKKATTAAADTSSEIAKRSKESFRNKMSQWIVSCLNPFRKPDCRLGRISSTDDFKHLARKLTHHVMAKELKHCRHPEDLEVNENVKAKAKDYIKKYMSKFGANYKKAQSPTPDD